MTVDTRGANAFKRLIRERYRARGLHQYDLARAFGVDDGTVSKWLSGDFRMDQQSLDKLANLLGISGEDKDWMELAHDLLHVPPRVRRYVRAMEDERAGLEVCDERMRKLSLVLDELQERRLAAPKVRPVLAEERPTSGFRKPISATTTPDEESGR
jgi:transcriptional regulator with XRE-family HTH domain